MSHSWLKNVLTDPPQHHARRPTVLGESSDTALVMGTCCLWSLMALHLTNNRLSRLASHVLQQLSGHMMDDLRLSGNPRLLQLRHRQLFHLASGQQKCVKDVEEIRFSDGSSCALAGRTIYSLPMSNLCIQPMD
ncbi:hypothetical protein MRX96_048536 [Rhipicephalus microplus]